MTILFPRVPTSTFWQSKHIFFFIFFRIKNDCHDGPYFSGPKSLVRWLTCGLPDLEERQSTGPQQGRAGILSFQAPSPPDLGILSLGCRVPGNLNTLKLPHVADK